MMNPTQTAIAAQLNSNKQGFTLAELIELVGKSETTVRKNLKEMADVIKDENNYRWSILSPSASIADADGAEVEIIDTITDDGTEPEINLGFDQELGGEIALEAARQFMAENDNVEDSFLLFDVPPTIPEIMYNENNPELVAEIDAAFTEMPEVPESDEEIPAAVETPAATTRRPYKKNSPDARTIRTNHITKSTLIVMPNQPVSVTVNGTDYTLDPADANPEADAKWITYCLTHGTCNSYHLVLDAYWASSYPIFCPECAKKMDSDQISKKRIVKKATKS